VIGVSVLTERALHVRPGDCPVPIVPRRFWTTLSRPARLFVLYGVLLAAYVSARVAPAVVSGFVPPPWVRPWLGGAFLLLATVATLPTADLLLDHLSARIAVFAGLATVSTVAVLLSIEPVGVFPGWFTTVGALVAQLSFTVAATLYL
jgi:hypothetical protein